MTTTPTLPPWRPGCLLTRAEHERAQADGLTPLEATQRHLADVLALL